MKLEDILHNIPLVSTRIGYQLSIKKPGAGLALLGLENAYSGLLLHQGFGMTDSNEALNKTRAALVTAYEQSMPHEKAEDEVEQLTSKIQGKLGRITPVAREIV